MQRTSSWAKLIAALVTSAAMWPLSLAQASESPGPQTALARAPSASPLDFSSYEWQPILTSAPWAARAGLQVIELHDALYLMGGRTPLNPAIVPVPGASQRDEGKVAIGSAR